ncbi:MAG: secretin N-terminal domain-containing protein [Rhodocyclaceae bacterium]|nr:secretin N-terminal domain-containing protein [Rhodocyclaceae bacterium]
MRIKTAGRYVSRLASGIFLAIMLTACATHSPAIYESEVLAGEGRLDEALVRLESALKEKPNNAELRLAMAQTRERIISRQLLQIQDQLKQDQSKRQQEDIQRPIVTEKPAPIGLDKPINVDFKGATLAQVCQVLYRTAGLNFIFDKDVPLDQPITITLRRTPVREVLSLILLSQQLEQRTVNAETVMIYPNTPSKARDYQPLTVRSFYLTNIEAKTAATTLRTILKARDLVADEKQNVVVMRDTPEAIRMAEKLLAVHDMPEPEVMLEVEILEVKRSRLQELGLLWPSSLMLTPLSSTAGGPVTLKDLINTTSASLAAAVPTFGINARAESGDANVLANPRIRTRNREIAKIMIGDRVPNITTTSTSTGFVAESVQYMDIGLKLEVQPTIYLDNEVAIRINLEVSNIAGIVQSKSGTQAYQIGTRNASTVLRLKDGENQVLAGLISDEERSSGNKIPGLGDLSVLGRLFGSRRDEGQKTELVLSITPRLVRNTKRPSIEQTEFSIGPESAMRPSAPDMSYFTEAVPVPTPPAAPGGIR